MFCLMVHGPHGPLVVVRNLEFCHAVLVREAWHTFAGVEAEIVAQRSRSVHAAA